ncbi:LysR family transcriptional regulator [Paenibacillus turpanensis]|uniref:LysR family transcriptional regulator n=1 Tax=Paenibacillus turpanensis TaxID=2689078 RepID=UPI001A9F42ED|nr:LysR family transcriptional regulator [Paenibacillus turpanensis]
MNYERGEIVDINAFRTFQWIVKHGSFNRAAEEMNYAQSTVTTQIQKLEADLGIQLIQRGKKIRLTEAGREFYEQSQEILQRMEQLRTSLTDLHTGESGVVRIGVMEPTASFRMPTLLKPFTVKYPKVKISQMIAGTSVLLESLLQEKIDFAICSSPNVGSELYFQPLFHEKFIVLMPDDHPLSGFAELEPALLQGYRLLVTSASCAYRRKVEMVLRESGVLAMDTMEVGSMTAMKPFVQNRFGIALVPSFIVDPVPEGLTVRPLRGASVDMLIGLVCRASSLTPTGANLYNWLKQELHAL